MRNEQLLSETAVNSPARLRSRWAQLLQAPARQYSHVPSDQQG